MHLFTIGLLSASLYLLQLGELPSLVWGGVVLLITIIIAIYLRIQSANNFVAVKARMVTRFPLSTKAQPLDAHAGPNNSTKHSIIIDLTLCYVMGFGVAFCWALYTAHHEIEARLPTTLEGIDLLVVGKVVGIPQRINSNARFEFIITSANFILPDSTTVPQFQSKRRLRLSWYRSAPQIQSGDSWQLRVRLKRPNGFMNPAGFDYEAWLFRHGINAVGYVRSGKHNILPDQSLANRQLGTASGLHIDRIRQNLVIKITDNLKPDKNIGLVTALVVGDRSAITPQQWQTMRDTGTNHLMAISGLHIGLVAGLIFFLIRWLWSISSRLMLHIPAQKAAAVAAILAAFLYAGLAGFSIPTMRAFIMVTIAMLSLVFQRRLQAGQYLSFALLGVLIVDPFAPMDAGFWLSFIAVAVLLLGMSHRLGHKSLWWRWGRSQWVVFIGLMPFITYYFAAIPLSAPLANIIAIPWVSFLTVPVSLVSVVLMSISEPFGALVLRWAAYSLEILWPVLEWMQTVIPVYLLPGAVRFWALLAAIVGSTILLLPQGVPARWLGLLWLLPLFWPQIQRPATGEVTFTVLDVGQGLSVVVETANHVLVYDTGAKFSRAFDSANAAVLPYLRQRNVQKIDTLVLSHDDIDHVGSATSLLAGVAVQKILSSYKPLDKNVERKACYQGQSWSWDHVKFEVLHPPKSIYAGMTKDNNKSCVIRVSTRSASLLLTGDIEAVVEKRLVNSSSAGKQPNLLKSDILVVPHHGSASSSTQSFIDQVDPRIAVASTGYRNRYGFPKPHVVERYLHNGIQFFTTAQQGAMTFTLGGPRSESQFINPNTGQKLSIVLNNAVRINQKRFWFSR